MAEPEPLDFVAVECHHERATLAIIDVMTRLRLELRAIFRPLPLAFQRKRQQIVTAWLVLRRCGQHAGSSKTGASACGGTLEDHDEKSAQHQPPGNRQADDPGADDGNVSR